jgi:hypothetical protein
MTPESKTYTLVMTGRRAACAEACLQRLHDAVSRDLRYRLEQHCHLRVVVIVERYSRLLF